MRLRFKFALSVLLWLPFSEAWRAGGVLNQRVTLDGPSDVEIHDVDPKVLYSAHNFSVPVDHFPNKDLYTPHSNGTFPLRYWYDSSFYKPGGPVFVLASGETTGEDRLPYLQKGIISQLSQATNGLGVILEHRYYGTSFPVPDLSTPNLRFLTTEQALADTQYFAQNIVFEGLEHLNLTASNAQWIAYGGSYAGAFVAFLRVLYPETFYGSIASSAVTEAIYDYWEYFEPIRIYGPRECVHITQEFVEFIDSVLVDAPSKDSIKTLKKLFGFQNITDDRDFASALTNSGIGGWQGRNWDPSVSSPRFAQYCKNITAKEIIYTSTEALRETVLDLNDEFDGNLDSALNQTLNFIGWANQTLVQPCLQQNLTQDQCFGTQNATYYAQTSIDQHVWRSWSYQVCTEWAYFQTSNAPSNIRTLQSRLIDIPYLTTVCRLAFNITAPPNISSINQYGGFNIEYDQLAFIDGEADPWRWATPHAPTARYRKNTISKPFIQIEDAVHHWDENGLFPNETTKKLPPKPVRDSQHEIVAFVKEWVAKKSTSHHADLK